ncbi:MAG: hypothetical protein LUC41_02630 [Clostridiales bacterium]|nr:hypothetical protein [Clostridiales bacterium]
MTDYKIDEFYRQDIGYSSFGMSGKYYKDGCWYKQNIGGYEGKAERICTMILAHSSVKDYVSYEECTINGIGGSRSKSFLSDGENVVTFQRLYDFAGGGSLKNKIRELDSVEDRISFVLGFINDYTGLDVRDYLQTTLNFDMLTFNVDRHFHNLAVIRTPEGFREAPLFDYGAALFSLTNIFLPEMTLQEKMAKMTPQPFAGSLEGQAMVLGSNIALDYAGIRRELRKETADIQEMLEYQLERYRDYFPDLFGLE